MAGSLKSFQENPQAQRYPYGIVGKSDCIRQLLTVIEKYRACQETVLIQGETGTGKELVAHALHDPDRLFSRVDCGGITETIAASSECGLKAHFLETNAALLKHNSSRYPKKCSRPHSELFGHRKGAFTGADQGHIGIFKAAHGGTLFPDEVENLSMRIQEQLLEILQEKQIRRVGETRKRKIDVRVLASTNIDLLQAAADGLFRKDLYYRLQVLVIDVPPLRKRLEDIPDLACHFLDFYNKRHQKSVIGIHPEVLAALSNYDWLGNVRELKNVMNWAVLLVEDGEMVGLELLPEDVLGISNMNNREKKTLREEIAEYEKSEIERELSKQKGTLSKTAMELGLSRPGLRKKLQ